MHSRIVWLSVVLAVLCTASAQAQPAQLQVGFAKLTITPVGPSPAGWGFTPEPTTAVWGEPFVDLNGNHCYDLQSVPPEPFIDDIRNTQIDPLSAGKWDGISTNAGFGGKCALGKLDDVWARAVVFSSGGKTVAMVSLDVVGFFQEEIDRIRNELAAAHPAIRLDALIVASTHVHESADTMGLWSASQGYVLDGKYPLFQKYIRARVVQAIATAWYARQSAYVKFARGTEARGLRDSRGPTVFDTDVWAAEFVRPLTGTTIGTLVNWSNHPEALGSSNSYISSDYPGGVRARMESVRGGTSIFFSGSVGGLMTPLGVSNVPGFPSDDHSYARTQKIGEIVADAAIAALATAPYATSTAISVAHKDFMIPMENQSLVALNQAGLFDRQLQIDLSGQIGVLTEMYAVRIGPAVFVTVPGELFPEIANGGFGRDDAAHPTDPEEYCPEADTGSPYEPVIRDQFVGATYKFLFGLGQDELGYIVPKYDFWAFGFPPGENDTLPIPPPVPPDGRPPIYVGVVEANDPCGVSHYEETVSAASTMAPLVACTAAELAGHDPFNTYDTDPEYAACSPENTTTQPGGIVLPPLP
jgi:hypothetical protein